MAIQFGYTSQAGGNGAKMLCYGGSGVGKTRLAATAPAPIIISAESGLLSLRQYNLPVIKIATYQDFSDAYSWCVGAKEAQQFGTIIVDSISEVAETILTAAKSKRNDGRLAYGDMADSLITAVKMFRDIPRKHVLIIAKEERQKDEITGQMLFGPMFPGRRAGPDMPYYFDEVFRYVTGTDPTTKQEWRALLTQPDGTSVAKDRSGVLDPYEQPHIANIIAKINGVK
jgi:AAA domain